VTGVLALGAGVIGTLLGTTPARAGAAQNPDVTNPAIRKIIDSRLARLPAVDKSKASGVIGENNKGFLEIRGIDAVKDPKDRDAVQRLVDEENADRTTQFAEVAKAEKADASQIPKIQERYAQTFRDRAKAGEWIQLPDGVWKKK
jgi:hypothetical protein